MAYYVGRFLQIAGLGITGFGCLIAFNPETPERDFWMFALGGLALFTVGHWIIPKK